MIRKIMLAWDGSENAIAAFGVAEDIARCCNAEMAAVSIVHAPEHAELPEEKERAISDARDFYARKLEALVQHSGESVVRPYHEVVPGDNPAEALMKHAEEGSFDLIVLGRRGLSRASWFRLGSVTDQVSRYAPCPVMVVPRRE